MSTCPTCGQSQPDHQSFCAFCGTSLQSSRVSPTEDASIPADPETSAVLDTSPGEPPETFDTTRPSGQPSAPSATGPLGAVPPRTAYPQQRPPAYSAPANRPPAYGPPAYTPPAYGAPAYAPPIYAQPVYATPAYAPPGMTFTPPPPVQSHTPATEALRKASGSPVFLVAILLGTLGLLVSLVQIFMPMDYFTYSFYRDALGELGTWSMALDSLNTTRVISAVLGMIPSILVVTGLWMYFASAKGKSKADVSTAGLTMVKVISIITMSWMILLGTIAMIGLFAGVSFLRTFSDGAEAGVVILVCFVILLAIAVVCIFNVLIFRETDKIRGIYVSGRVPRNFSIALGIFLCLAALIPAFLLFVNFSISAHYGVAWLSVSGYALSFGFHLMLAISLFTGRGKLSPHLFQYQPPPAPVYAPQPVYQQRTW